MEDLERKFNYEKENEETSGDVQVQIGKIFDILIDNWWLFLIFIIGSLSVGYFYLYRAIPQYKVHASLLIDESLTQNSGKHLSNSNFTGSTDLSDFLSGTNTVDNEEQVISTKDLMESVVKNLALNVIIKKRNRFGKYTECYKTAPFDIIMLNDSTQDKEASFKVKPITQGYKYLFKGKLNGKDSIFQVRTGSLIHTSVGSFELINNSYYTDTATEYQVNINTTEQALDQWNASLVVGIPNKQVSVLQLTLNSEVPEKGCAVLNELIRVYIHNNFEQKNAYLDSAITFINERVTEVKSDLNQSEAAIEDFKKREKVYDIPTQSQDLINNMTDFQKNKDEVAVQLKMVKTMLSYVEGNKSRILPSLINNADPAFLVLLDRYNGAQIQLDRLKLGATENNPQVINLKRQILNLKNDLARDLKNQRYQLSVQMQKADMQQGNNNATLQNIPSAERRYMDMSRQHDIMQSLYVYLLQKKEDFSIGKSSNLSSIRTIDAPRADRLPYTPKKPVLFAGALLLGLCLPFGFIFLKREFSRKVVRKEEVEAILPYPIIGSINHTTEFDLDIFQQDLHSILTEQFRIIRTNLQFLFHGGSSNSYEITSKCPIIMIGSIGKGGEGKSFTSCNLAFALSAGGSRVLMIDLDLRKPSSSRRLHTKRTPGFSDYIASEDIKLEDIIQSASNAIDHQIGIIAAGTIPPNPTELLMNRKVNTMLTTLKKSYDYIILDTPPLGLLADSQVIAKYVDSMILVVRLRYTFKFALRNIPDITKFNPKIKIGIVLNDLILKKSAQYGYKGGYGYGDYNIETKNSHFLQLLSKKIKHNNK